MRKCLLLILILTAFASSRTHAQITLSQYCTGFTAPCDIRNCGDSRLFVVEQPGRIRIIDSTGTLQTTPFLDISGRVLYGGERGLLGLAFPSDYQDSGYFYVNYTSRSTPGTGPTTISRFRVSASNPDIADPNSEEILLVIYQPYSNHNGGCLAFSPLNGYLYIGTGDGGSQGDPGNRAQNPDTLLGKLLRLKVTSGTPGYEIPPTNQFAGNPAQGREEIWAIGMRNPWRFSFDPFTGDFWIGDVGQSTWEEVDFEAGGTTQGRNYGWRCYEGNATYNTSGCAPASSFTPPLYQYAHSGGNCSITGGYIYRGGKFADMYGKYFFTDYCVNQMRTLQKSGATATLANLGVLATGSYVAFGTDKWGELYAADAVGGRIMRFAGTTCNPVAAINGGFRDTIEVCGTEDVHAFTPKGQGFNYEWTIGGLPYLHPYDTITIANNGSDFEVVLQVTDQNGCIASDTVLVISHPLPVVDFSLDSIYCNFDAPENMLPVPPGGVFSGTGINGTAFDPAVADSGINVVTYTYTDAFGCTNSITKNTYVDYCTALSDAALLSAISVYPNPNNGNFRLSIPSNRTKNVILRVTDPVGRMVYQDRFSIDGGATDYDIRLEKASPGIYLLEIAYEGSISRVVKFTVRP